MTKVNESATVGMSTTVGECLQQWGNVCNSGGNERDSGRNVCNSGKIEYVVRNSRLENVIHNFAYIGYTRIGLHWYPQGGATVPCYTYEALWHVSLNIQ